MKPESSQSQPKGREKLDPKKKGMKQGKKSPGVKKGPKKPREDRPSFAGGPGVSERPPSPLVPLRQFVDNPSQMIEQLFQALGREELAAMQPTILQGLPLEEVKLLCLKQLESMSKQDILDILSGCEFKEQTSAAASDATSVPTSTATGDGNIASDAKKGSEAVKEGPVAADPCEALELFPAREDMEMLAIDEPLSTSEKTSGEPAVPEKKTSTEGDLATNLTKMQMEILELQLRRRAIKALLRSQKGPGEGGDDDDDDDDDDDEIILMNEEKG